MKKVDFSLVLALSIPLILVLIILGTIYLPSLFTKPKYDFIYTYHDYSDTLKVSVENGELVTSEPTYQSFLSEKNKTSIPSKTPKIYLYDVQTHTDREISLEEVNELTLYNHDQSPDGFEIDDGHRDTDLFSLLFYSSSSKNHYLIGKGISQKLNLVHSNDINYYNFQFIAWIL